MANFFAELKRRHIYRVAAAYAVVAWVLLQLIANVAPILVLPPWVARAFLLLLVIGFPLAILLAWTREPEGDLTQRAMTGKLDWALMGALVVVIGLVSYQQLAPMSETTTASQTPGIEAAREAAASPSGAIAIAVLPFANLSGDASQEFFSDGMTEEITSALARVPDLRVVARTSAYQFRDQNRDIQSIGQQLRATHFIEGSVRKAGDRVRITAQLIKADDGTHVWAENYERELTDVFAIQEEIARAIATSLRMPLGVRAGENLVSSRTIDPDSYQQYLRAKALYRARGLANVRNAADLMEEVVAKNPDYAPGWALLSWAHTVLPNFSSLPTLPPEQLFQVLQSSREKAEPAARRAIELDSSLTDGYVALGTVQTRAGKYSLAEELYSKALALDPNQPEALNMYSQMASYVGHVDKALSLRRQSLALEPFDPNSNRDFAAALWVSGQDDAALAILKSLSPNITNRFIASVQAGAGRFSEAADTLLSAPSGSYPPAALAEAVRLLRMAPTEMASENPMPLGPLDFVYLFAGAPIRVLDTYERNVAASWMNNAFTVFLWHSSYAPARKSERFKAFVRNAGMVEYWREKGWPDFCHPTSGDAFECS